VLEPLRTLGWLTCIVYSTIPLFWLMIHPLAQRWRQQLQSPYRLLGPAWMGIWIVFGAITRPWRHIAIYSASWNWIPAIFLFAAGIFIYLRAGAHFSWSQLAGLPEISLGNHSQQLVTTGIRSRVRHPIYLAHLCGLLAWSIGTGLVVCWALTVFAIVIGTVMIRMEDAELEERFGEEYRRYRLALPAVLPRI
jgi:protein-S-isoprenylcysteine O-methyltransferase Ste14